MRNYAAEFREFVKRNYGRSEEEIEAIWFRDNDGCYPAEYIGEDLLDDIMNKFYEPLDFIRSLLPNHSKYIRITIMPSYESITFYVVTYMEEIVLEEDFWKAWHFWFDGDGEFNEWVEETLKKWKDRIRNIAS